MIYFFYFLIYFLMLSPYPSTVFGEEKINFHVAKPNFIHLFWKKENGELYGSFQSIKEKLEREKKTLIFAMNGGMFHFDHSPVGLYIENFHELQKINLSKGYGNFFLLPNGVFFITKDNHAFVKQSSELADTKNIKYATQSGPMLLLDGKIHPKIKKKSKNKNIRNGVGILKDGEILFAISNEEITFYEFADFFLKKGCKNALYLDGAISKMYLPKLGKNDASGNFGVIITEISQK